MQVMSVKSAYLYAPQVDALEQLGKSDFERGGPGWIVVAHPSMPVVRPQTVRSLADRGLCRISWPHGVETARITQAGRKVLSEIQAVRARIGLVA
jgi:hypothetical protein